MELGPREFHPFGPFIPPGATTMLIGTFPIGQFSDPTRHHELTPKDLMIHYGGSRNQFWRLIGASYGIPLDTAKAIKKLLSERKIALGDVIASCRRRNHSPLDGDLKEIEWDTGLKKTLAKKGIRRLVFTSKNAERWFHRHIDDLANYEAITLPSSSGVALRGLARTPGFQAWVKNHPQSKVADYRQHVYRSIFRKL